MNDNKKDFELVKCPYCGQIVEAPPYINCIFICPSRGKELITYDISTANQEQIQEQIEKQENKLVYCQECGKQIADNLSICPNCGAPQAHIQYKSDNSAVYLIISILIPVLGLVLIFAAKGKESNFAARGTFIGFILFMLLLSIII